MSKKKIVYAVSDSTGETAEHAVRAALAQFDPTSRATMLLVGQVRDEAAIGRVVQRALTDGAFIVYTLVEPNLRGRMATLAQEQGVIAVDLIGSLIWELSAYMGTAPLSLPGLGHETDEAYFRRIEAVEFAVNHDDGRNLQDLGHADLILIGASRSSKTPLSNYIAHRGYKVSNIPLVQQLPPPKELEEVDPRRVFALVIDPGVLTNIRRSRLQSMGVGPEDTYGSLKNTQGEIRWCRTYISEHPGWTVVDITERAIEETAASILTTWQERFKHPTPARTARDAMRKPRPRPPKGK